MVTKTYISKCNTIVKDDNVNLGINPVAELNFGRDVSRIILYFDLCKLHSLVEDKTYPDISKLRHELILYNCASLDNTTLDKKLLKSDYQGLKERASSCDVILFLIPNDWDGGRGFDWTRDATLTSRHVSYSVFGSNWYNAKTGIKWPDEGIYSPRKLSVEYDKFSSSEENQSKIVIGRYHFEYGNENLRFDITETVNKMLNGEIPNYGIGIAFTPLMEEKKLKFSQYIGFFTPYTNSFFEPYLETRYEEYISDDRNNFYLDKSNKLYFYSNIGGKPTNLDNLPTCSINDIEYEVKQATKGVYYVDIELPSTKYDENTMLYDIWGNLTYNGKKLKDVELDFVTKAEEGYFQFEDMKSLPKTYIPNIKGILHGEQIRRGDIRKIIVEARVPYTTNEMEVIDDMEYRLYVMNGVEELDVIAYDKVEKSAYYNYFLINTAELLPQKYYIDVRFSSNLEVRHFRKLLTFDIVNDVTEKYQ